MEKENNKNMWIWVGIIALVVIVIVAMKMNKSDDSMTVETPTQDAIEVTEDTTVGSVNTPAVVNGTSVSMSYADAVVKYKDARIQVNDQCEVVKPNNLTFKNNTTIMLDNRSKVAHNFKIGSPVSVKAYGFKLIKLSSEKVPATWLVDCDGRQNVATILLQK